MPTSVSYQRPFVHRVAWLAAIVAASGSLWSQVSEARQTDPFSPLLGVWRGSGSITQSNGRSERISCRADYSQSESGEALSQSLVCASDSYRFDIQSYVVADSRGVQGYRQETTRNISGHLIGEVGGGRFKATSADRASQLSYLLRLTDANKPSASRRGAATLSRSTSFSRARVRFPLAPPRRQSEALRMRTRLFARMIAATGKDTT